MAGASLLPGRVGSQRRGGSTASTCPGSVRAFHGQQPPGGGARGSPSARRSVTRERVLRYPGGGERRIRYPEPSTGSPHDQEEEEDDDGYTYSLTELWAWSEGVGQASSVTPFRGKNIDRKSGSKPPAASSGRQAKTDQEAQTGGSRPVEETKREEGQELRASKRFFDDLWELDSPEKEEQAPVASPVPGSPAELLRQLNSEDYREAQAVVWEKVRSSYEVLSSCPWVVPRPLFCLASAPMDSSGQGSSYTLRTRLEDEGISASLDKVFGKSKPGIGSKFKAYNMVDGLITFEDPDSAGAYLSQLEAAGHLQVQVAEVDSHKLFRMVQDVKGVVVLFREGRNIPQPEHLRASLKGQNPLLDQ